MIPGITAADIIVLGTVTKCVSMGNSKTAQSSGVVCMPSGIVIYTKFIVDMFVVIPYKIWIRLSVEFFGTVIHKF